MTLPTLYHPDSESVAVAWALATLPVGAATSLPRAGAWTTFLGTVQGFATITVAGGRTTDYGLRLPVISFGTWASVPGSDNPQWGAASQLAEIIVAECLKLVPDVRTVQKSPKYAPAFIQSVRLNAEPRRVPDQDESVAHFETEVIMAWTEVPS
jgi:hypothetical protein